MLFIAGAILITPMEESKRFMKDVFSALGAPPENAEIVALNLLEADYRGHYSHGMNRVGKAITLRPIKEIRDTFSMAFQIGMFAIFKVGW